MKNKLNREHKDSLFTFLLSQKKYALQVYNALNESNYDNPDDVEITTLENVVFINIKNDVSFVLENIFSLYEHQATYNPNMPLRSLFYMSDSYERIIANRGANIYGSKLVKIPTPKCVVFYNGEDEYPDKMVLYLSDSFENQNVEGDIQIKVTMLNINYCHNKKLLANCEVLRGYSLYNEKFREYNKGGTLSKTEAAHKAIDYCIKHNVLADFFEERRNEVVGMILEYTAEKHEAYLAKLESEILEQEQRIEGLDNEVAEKEKRIEGLGQELAEKKLRVEGLGQELAEKERQVEGLGQELAEKERQVEGLGQELAEKERQVEGLGQELSEKDKLIEKLLEENAKLKEGK